VPSEAAAKIARNPLAAIVTAARNEAFHSHDTSCANDNSGQHGSKDVSDAVRLTGDVGALLDAEEAALEAPDEDWESSTSDDESRGMHPLLMEIRGGH